MSMPLLLVTFIVVNVCKTNTNSIEIATSWRDLIYYKKIKGKIMKVKVREFIAFPMLQQYLTMLHIMNGNVTVIYIYKPDITEMFLRTLHLK